MVGRRRTLGEWLLAALAIGGIAAFALSYVPDFWRKRHTETEYETVLYYFAQNLGEPALCERISWTAYRSYNLVFGGGGASFWRSDCYEQVAELRHDASICWQVRPLVDLDPLSSGYSAVACRRRTRAGYSSGIALPDDVLIRTFERLGYGVETMGRQAGTPPAIRWQDVYRRLEKDPTAVARAQQLVAQPDGSLPAQDRSYLAHLAAIGTGDPKWCGYIPAAQAIGHVAGPFRDWCFFTLAFDANDSRICARMTPAAAEAKVLDAEAHGVRREIAEQLGLHAECLRSERHIGPRLHYAAELPPDEQTATRLLDTLHVVMPSARDWPAAELATFYRNFLFSLRPAQLRDASRSDAHATLVARLLALRSEP